MAKLYKQLKTSTEIHYLSYQNTSLTVEQPDVEVMQEINVESIQAAAYQQGYQAGLSEALEQSTRELDELKQQLHTSLSGIPQVLIAQRNESADEIAQIVLHICEEFFIDKAKNPHEIEQQINRLLSELNQQQNIELYLHPKEIAQLQAGLINLQAQHLNGLKVKSDDNLTLGGYVLKTEHGFFEASIEKNIDKLKQYLLDLRGLHAQQN